MKLRLLLMVPLVVLTGCIHKYTVHNNLPIYATNDEADALKAAIGAARSDTAFTPEKRNDLQNRLITYSNEHYFRNRDRLERGRDWMTFSAEVAGTTLSAVSALVGDVDLKSIISTASTLSQSTKVSLDKDLFAQQTTSTIVSKMDAQRAIFLKQIMDSQKLNLPTYGLEQALNDVLTFDDAGTVQSALIALNAQAGSDKATAEKALGSDRDATTKDDQTKHPAQAVHDAQQP